MVLADLKKTKWDTSKWSTLQRENFLAKIEGLGVETFSNALVHRYFHIGESLMLRWSSKQYFEKGSGGYKEYIYQDLFPEAGITHDVSNPSDDGDDTAMRFNSGKSELSYLLSAPVAMKGLTEAFEFGAKKYARDNWKKGLERNAIVDSLLRHLTAAQNGETHDPETGIDHLHHVHWNAMALAEQYSTPTETKD